MSKRCCGTCEYGYVDKELLDYICVNSDSEFVTDYVDYDFYCDVYVKKRGKKCEQYLKVETYLLKWKMWF